MQRGQSFTVLPWPCSQRTNINQVALEVVGRVCARQTGFNEQLSGDLSLRLKYCPHKQSDKSLIELVTNTAPYLAGVFYVLGITLEQIKKLTVVWGMRTPGGRVEVLVEEIDSY